MQELNMVEANKDKIISPCKDCVFEGSPKIDVVFGKVITGHDMMCLNRNIDCEKNRCGAYQSYELREYGVMKKKE